jgi:hypothetical protein
MLEDRITCFEGEIISRMSEEKSVGGLRHRLWEEKGEDAR